MANNRMYLTCPTCKKQVMIAKAYATWDGVYGDPASVGERLDAFIREHDTCGPPADLTAGTRFTLDYESDDSHHDQQFVNGVVLWTQN